MLKIGIIGLGDIACKAYLPVISRKKVEVHLYTRKEDKLFQLGEEYRFQNKHQSLDALINSGIKAAFVHTATSAHFQIVEELLSNNIHVYVDKPVTYDFKSTEKLVELARKKNLTLMAGFNRRYAPAYLKLKELKDPNMIIMQKNRQSLPGDIRTFIFDDFIHVVDTLLFLFPHPIEKLIINGKKKGDLLYHVVVQFVSRDGTIAIGIMNRDSGTTEEKLEVFSSVEKRVVYNVTDTIVYQNKKEIELRNSDWESTLLKRGFEDIIEGFFQTLEDASLRSLLQQDLLLTHKICEQVVGELQLIT